MLQGVFHHRMIIRRRQFRFRCLRCWHVSGHRGNQFAECLIFTDQAQLTGGFQHIAAVRYRNWSEWSITCFRLLLIQTFFNEFCLTCSDLNGLRSGMTWLRAMFFEILIKHLFDFLNLDGTLESFSCNDRRWHTRCEWMVRHLLTSCTSITELFRILDVCSIWSKRMISNTCSASSSSLFRFCLINCSPECEIPSSWAWPEGFVGI